MPARLSLEVSPYDTILTLKKLIQNQGCSFPQNLIFEGRHLQDEDTVDACEINPGSKLYVTETRTTVPSISKPVSNVQYIQDEPFEGKLCPASSSSRSNSLSLEVDSDSTMADVREGVRRLIGSLPQQYRVVHDGNVISKNTQTFEELGIMDGSSLYFIVEKE
jgi:hypothetical protein